MKGGWDEQMTQADLVIVFLAFVIGVILGLTIS